MYRCRYRVFSILYRVNKRCEHFRFLVFLTAFCFCLHIIILSLYTRHFIRSLCSFGFIVVGRSVVAQNEYREENVKKKYFCCMIWMYCMAAEEKKYIKAYIETPQNETNEWISTAREQQHIAHENEYILLHSIVMESIFYHIKISVL